MITGQLRSRIDKLWDEFWTGGISNPLTVIEQITYLMFIRLLDISEVRRQKQADRAKGKRDFRANFKPDQQHLRWQNLMKLGGDQLLKTVRDEVFPHLRDLAGTDSTFGRYMQDATFMIQKAALLVRAMEMINDLPLEKTDTKGDLYEYLLSKLNTAGINGQFRTPRHIIRLMVDLLKPKPTDVVGDPACGTAGFLVAVLDYLYEHFTSSEGVIEEDIEGDVNRIFTGDLLEPYRDHLQRDMFHGFDFDVTMLRLAAMNLMLHGVDNPDIAYQDTLSNSFPEKRPAIASDHFDLILANPPFKGSLDHSDVHPSLTSKVKTKKTELLFVALILRMLKLGGRAAVIVPDGVLFGSSTAHTALRKILVDDNQLEAVVKLPPGAFRPYASVATAFLIFTKGGKTNTVWYYDVQADGFSLDDKRDPIPENDLPDVRTQWAHWNNEGGKTEFANRSGRAFAVTADEIRATDYDLALNRYKEHQGEEKQYDDPQEVIARLRTLESEIAQDLSALEGMLK